MDEVVVYFVLCSYKLVIPTEGQGRNCKGL